MKQVTTEPTEYIESILYWAERKPHPLELDKMEYPNYTDNCRTLDVGRQVNRTDSYLRFSFHFNPQYSTEIFVEDKMSSLKRANAFAKFSTTGDRIFNDDHTFKGYTLEIEQEIFEEKDKDIRCRDYPTELYSTFSECDEAFVQDWMKSHMPDLTPIWASKSLNETTIQKKNVTLADGYRGFLYGAAKNNSISDPGWLEVCKRGSLTNKEPNRSQKSICCDITTIK